MTDTAAIAATPLPTEESMLSLLAKTCETAWQLPLSRSDVDYWLSNFRGDVYPRAYEKQLALWLLLNFVYYNYQEVIHLSRVLFRRFLHHHLEPQNLENSAAVQLASTKLLQRVLFHQLGGPSESGGFLLYLFRQANDLPVSRFVTSPERVPDEVDMVVFLDDVCLSGSQASQYLKQHTQHIAGVNRVLLTLVATPEATELLRADDTPLIAAHFIDERSKCFSPKANLFAEYHHHQTAARQLALHYGARACAAAPLGYNNDAYAFGFFYNTPDNTLPIFWSDHGDWKPIMKRYDKKYTNGGYHELGAYV